MANSATQVSEAGAEPQWRPLAPWLQRQLQALLHQRGHAVLLHGATGLGQWPLAMALARAWLCEQPTPEGACGQCGSCHAIDVRTHPDLQVLLPDQLAMDEGWPLDDKTRDKIEKKEIKPSKWIRVDAAREVVAFSQMTRSRGSTKVVVIYPADRMNMEAANTLLKTLEEPAGAVRFVMATEAAHALLPTLRSRCQGHSMVWPDEQEAVAWMRAELQQPTASDELLAVWWRAAGGRPEEALEWARSGAPPTLWGQIPRALALGDWSVLRDWPPARQLDVLQKVCHDLLAVRAGAGPRFFALQDLPAPPRWSALLEWRQQLADARRSVEHPYNAGLMQEAWSSEASRFMALN